MNSYKAIRKGFVPHAQPAPTPEPEKPPAETLADEAWAARSARMMKERELDMLRMERMEDQLMKLHQKIRFSEFTHVDDPLDCFYDGDEYMQDTDEVEWLVDGFIPKGYLAVLGGGSKSGKSCLATALAISVADGEPFLGMNTRPSPVLWFASEETPTERQAALKGWPHVPKNLKTTHCRPRIEDRRDQHYIRHCVERTGAGLVVIDSLFAATGASLADGRSARDALTGLKELAAEQNVTVLVLHHINKESSAGLNRDRFAESNQILAAASMDILFDAHPRDGYREIRLSSRGRGEWCNRELRIRSEGIAHYELIAAGDEETPVSQLREDTILRALASSETPLTAEDLAQICQSPVTTTRNRLTMMVREGTVRMAGKRNRAALFVLGDGL